MLTRTSLCEALCVWLKQIEHLIWIVPQTGGACQEPHLMNLLTATRSGGERGTRQCRVPTRNHGERTRTSAPTDLPLPAVRARRNGKKDGYFDANWKTVI